jgi:hypothetical protein
MVKVILIIVIMAILMEDGSSIKKTAEEEREDAEIAAAVNRTLAEEEKKRKEDEERKKTEDETRGKKKDEKKKISEKKAAEGSGGGSEERDEALPSSNITCPDPVECPEPRKCPAPTVCPEIEPCEPCGPCPPIHCQPCPVCNNTSVASPEVVNVTTTRLDCPSEPASPAMTVPVAMLVGACASLLVTGVATAIGLLLRYVSPTVSGFLFLAVIIIIWYLSSQYPETARELGGRAMDILREASVALGHRIMAAVQRHQDQVGFPILSLISSLD